MRISIFAVGRLKKGPEYELNKRYFQRFVKVAASLGFNFSGIREIAESRASFADRRRREESAVMLSDLSRDIRLIVLDECGKSVTSCVFAEKIAGWRDEGQHELVFALGGPDGHSDRARERADFVLSFGLMTWPHQLARIMLGEQLYRVMTILSSHPYHRE
ncbi:MAG: 23S rRNA (pseudouridine1915-N3)-methyltransferase [Candidatus Tokpelaia sp. JSC189]|nr:MAG: 23S rRNA (pseudouridine1915-N3)-methyltransferase [Candidatus Tokpelaia sp. JSC189]